MSMSYKKQIWILSLLAGIPFVGFRLAVKQAEKWAR